MDGFAHFLGKELKEFARTWRLPVLAAAIALFALTGPVVALYTPELLKSMQASQPGVVIQLPDPSWRDAYAQWVKNLSQIVAFVAIITAAGSVAGELASGSGLLVLTKPVSRTSFVLAKAASLFAMLFVLVCLGTAVTQGLTLLVFGEAPFLPVWAPTLSWLLFSALLVSVTVVLSSLVSTLAAAGLGVGVFFALSMASLWGPLVRYTPVGLVTAPGQLLAGKPVALGWPVGTAVVSIVLLLALASVLFSRREI